MHSRFLPALSAAAILSLVTLAAPAAWAQMMPATPNFPTGAGALALSLGSVSTGSTAANGGFSAAGATAGSISMGHGDEAGDPNATGKTINFAHVFSAGQNAASVGSATGFGGGFGGWH